MAQKPFVRSIMGPPESCRIEDLMYWNKKDRLRSKTTLPTSPPPDRSATDNLAEAAEKLTASLNTYSEAAYLASKDVTNHDLVEAAAKVAAARKMIREGRIAYALCRCIPEHVEHWPAWIARSDFLNYVSFDATDIQATQLRDETNFGSIKIISIEFSFNQNRYKLNLRDAGMSPVPDSTSKFGQLEFWQNETTVAKFDIQKDLLREYASWEFADVLAFKVGSWMKDIIDIATQIETAGRKRFAEYSNNKTLEVARDIDIE